MKAALSNFIKILKKVDWFSIAATVIELLQETRSQEIHQEGKGEDNPNKVE